MYVCSVVHPNASTLSLRGTDRAMKISNNGAMVILGVFMAWIVAAVAIWSFGATWFAEVDAITTLLLPSVMIIASIILGGVFLLVLGGTYKISSSMGKVWAFLGIGMLLWLVGETIYFYYDLLGEEPFPTIADVFYYVAYIPLTAGLVIQMRLLKLSLSAAEKVLVTVLSVIVSVIIVYFVLWPAIDAFIAVPDDPVGLVAGAMYTVLDIVLLVFVFTVSAKLRHGKINTAWILILAGLIMTTVADSLYWIADNQGIDEIFNWYDLAFLIGYLLVTMGAIKGINVISTSFSS
jgi:hypothetical protein